MLDHNKVKAKMKVIHPYQKKKTTNRVTYNLYSGGF